MVLVVLWKMFTPVQDFPNIVKGWRGAGRNWNSTGGGVFLSGVGNLRRGDFDHSKLYQS